MVDVSIITPMHNASKWLEACLQSVLDQDFNGTLEISIYNDCSTDESVTILESWCTKFEDRGIGLVIGGHTHGGARGVGYAKNKAIAQSRGRYLCFLDADDVMMKERVSVQYQVAKKHDDILVGCCVVREPAGSTERYMKWANTLTPEQLYTQAYTSHGPTVLMPTWFCDRRVVDRVGGFSENGKGTPEDLIFFYAHLSHGGKLERVNKTLLVYRYHEHAATFSVSEETIWSLRVAALEERVLATWPAFTIWNAGKQGRKLYRSLSTNSQAKVAAFCDVDEKKISKGYYTYEESEEMPRPRIPIVHFTKARGPFVICMKQDLTGGAFEANLSSLNLKEGQDYYHFN